MTGGPMNAGPSIAGRRILVVEDEFMVAAMLADALEEAGAIVLGPAANLAEGLRLAGDGGFDLAVLDWNLGGERCTPLARALQEAGVGFVISSGYGGVEPEFATAPIMPKPYDPQDLIVQLGQLLGQLPL